MSSLRENLGKIARSRGREPDDSETSRVPEKQSPKIYLKAMPLRKISDLNIIKREVKSGNVLIVKVSPLASRSIEDVRKAVNDLCEFVKTVDGDIARLGEERIVITPSGVRIWREKPVPSQEQVPTAA